MSWPGGDPCPADALAELALGTLAGEERSGVLAHVARCRTCQAELAQLAVVADDLLLLAPVAEAPLGFELRTVERLRAAERDGCSVDRGPGHPALPARRWRRGLVSLAAAVLLVLAGLGIGFLSASPGRTGRTPERPAVVLAPLSSGGHEVGHVRVVTAGVTWLEVTVGKGLGSGLVSCVARLRDGRVVQLGWFQVGPRGSSWSVRLDADAAQLASAQLLGPAGAVVATAQL